MGSKGATTTTNQQQTYNPAGAGYIQNALNQAGNAASLPFNIPQAPVAGFSQDQQSAFNSINNAQGMAQPYINQAANYFSPQGAQQFLNPYADNVMAGLKDVFGQQQSQATGQLTQAAGGVGADRISVGQGELAKQQGLAAGQTLSGLYGNAVQQAQSAGYGTAALGSQAQNAAISGAQAQLGTGGLQQQLQQAQLNAPYQQQLAQAAFPYQQAQFLAGITGSLAPGLGGTTTGTGSQTAPGPSIWSQLLGLGTAGVGAAGGAGAFKGGSGKGSGSPSAAGTPGSPYYGPVNDGSYAEGGEIPNDDPVDVSHGYIPDEKLTQIQPSVPQLNLTPQQPQGGGGGSGGVSPADVMKLAMAFMARGGGVNPYAFADAGAVPSLEDRFDPVKDALAGRGDAYFDAQGDNYSTFEGSPGMAAANHGVIPLPQPRPAEAPAPTTRSMSYTSDDTAPAPAVAAINKAAGASNPYAGGSGAPGAGGAPAAAPAPEEAPSKRDTGFAGSPWAALMAAGLGIAGGTSPYAGVNIGQGGLQGLKMLESQRAASQKDETTDQAAKRLAQEAKFHEDQYSRIPLVQQKQLERQKAQDDLAWEKFDRPYHQLNQEQQVTLDRQQRQDDLAQERFNRPYKELTKAEQAQVDESKRQHDLARLPQGFQYKTDEKGNVIGQEPIPGGPHSPEQMRAEAEAKRLPAMSRESMSPLVDAWMAGDRSVATSIGKGAQGAQNINQMWDMIAERLHAKGEDGRTIAAARADFMGQQAALRVAEQRAATVTSAVNEAKSSFPLVLSTSAALPRTDYPKLNWAAQWWRENTGSPQQRSFAAAIQSAVTAYSQAIARTGGNSVWAQQHAEALLSKTDGDAALRGTLKTLNTEMEIAKNAPEETRQSILDHIVGHDSTREKPPPAAPAAAAPATPAALPDAVKAQLKEGQVTTFGNGQKWMLQNGQPKQVQ